MPTCELLEKKRDIGIGRYRGTGCSQGQGFGMLTVKGVGCPGVASCPCNGPGVG